MLQSSSCLLYESKYGTEEACQIHIEFSEDEVNNYMVQFTNGAGDLVESYQRLKKWYLMPPCLTLNIGRYQG